MTTVIAPREKARAALAQMLEVEPSALGDHLSLRDSLALDSLTMMRVLTWLESQGATISADDLPETVGSLLSLLDSRSRLQVRIGGVPGLPAHLVARRKDPLVPVLETKVFRLTPIIPEDIGFLYALAVEPETGFRWRYRGSAPPIERFKSELWNMALLQFVVRRASDNQPVGLVVAYGEELSLRHTYLGAVFDPDIAGTGLAAQAVSLFVRHLFHTFPLDKIYMEIPGFNWPQVQSGQGSLFRVEGVLRDHDYYAGRYWDKYVCAMYPDDFEQAKKSGCRGNGSRNNPQ